MVLFPPAVGPEVIGGGLADVGLEEGIVACEHIFFAHLAAVIAYGGKAHLVTPAFEAVKAYVHHSQAVPVSQCDGTGHGLGLLVHELAYIVAG